MNCQLGRDVSLGRLGGLGGLGGQIELCHSEPWPCNNASMVFMQGKGTNDHALLGARCEIQR